jgi:4-hydroxyphenylpyruvate dioxygenase
VSVAGVLVPCLILNVEPVSFAQEYFQVHGPSLCAVGLRTEDEVQARGRATALLATQFEGRVGPNERTIPAIRAIGDSLFYFVGPAGGADQPFQSDFDLSTGSALDSTGPQLQTVDHLALAMPAEELSASLLVLRAILGLEARGVLEMPASRQRVSSSCRFPTTTIKMS